MSEVVKEWSTLTLSEIGLPRTQNVDPSNYPNEIFELYSVPSFSLSKPEIVPGSAIGSTKQLVEPGDVLLCKIVPHLVRVWCVPSRSAHRQIASGEWIVVRPDPAKADKQYLRYTLIEPGFRGQFMETVSGVGGSLMRARPKAVAQIRVPLPAKVEQRRIVAKLDSLLMCSKSAREELGRIPRLVERYKQAILAQGFRGELTRQWRKDKPVLRSADEIRKCLVDERDIRRRKVGIRTKGANRNIPPTATELPILPREWAWATFEECLWDLTVGHVGPMKSRYVAKGIPFLRSFNVRPNRIDLGELAYIDKTFDRELQKSKLAAGTIVVVRTGAPGVAAVITEELDGANCSDLVICRPIESLNSHYAAHYINSDFAQNLVRQNQVGVAQQHFNVGAMSSLAVPVAPIDEQVEIVRVIRTAFERIEKLQHEALRAADLLGRLDQATLAKTFRGELVKPQGTVKRKMVVSR